MEDRKVCVLHGQECKKTRELYELVFPEDSRDFVDYYYEEIASQNRIYGMMEDGKVLSMVHVNPYELKVKERECRAFYMTAVATRQEYRRQGLMTALMQKAFADLWKEEVPFVFLMPTEANIYRPFGFRHICGQNRMEMKVSDYLGKERLDSYPATYADVPDLSWFTSRLLKKKMGTYVKRTENYYERLLLEQEALKGDIAVLTRDGMICGWFFTSEEQDVPEVREAMVEDDFLPLLLPTIANCFRYDETVRLYGFSDKLGGREVPLMMGRIVNLASYFSLVKESVPEGFSFAVRDRWIPGNTGVYTWKEGRLFAVEDDPQLPIFSMEELIEKFPLPGPVFLNECV